MSNKNTRTSEILVDGQWQSISPIDIKTDMIFRMSEEDGTPVTWQGSSSWMAIKDAYYNEDGIVCIEYKKTTDQHFCQSVVSYNNLSNNIIKHKKEKCNEEKRSKTNEVSFDRQG